MSSNLKVPSDLLYAIRDVLTVHLPGVYIGLLDEQAGALGAASILIEPISMLCTTGRGSDGRQAHDMGIALHAVIGKGRDQAVREAVDLAAAAQQLVDDNCWGLPSGQIYAPRNLRAHRRDFFHEQTRYEAWRVLFFQIIQLGEPLYDDPIVSGDSLMVAEPFSTNISDPVQYSPLKEGLHA